MATGLKIINILYPSIFTTRKLSLENRVRKTFIHIRNAYYNVFYYLFILNFFFSGLREGHFFVCLFIYLWLCWVLVAARGLSLVVVSGGHSSQWCAGFSLRWLLLLRSTGSRCVGFSSCGTQTQQLWHADSAVVARRLSSCGTRA